MHLCKQKVANFTFLTVMRIPNPDEPGEMRRASFHALCGLPGSGLKCNKYRPAAPYGAYRALLFSACVACAFWV
jgi:hypothetical protein